MPDHTTHVAPADMSSQTPDNSSPGDRSGPKAGDGSRPAPGAAAHASFRPRPRGETREAVSTIPLWREVLDREQALRRVVDAEGGQRPPTTSYIPLAFSAAAVGVVATTGSVVLYREQLVLVRQQRPPQLRGQPVSQVPRLFTPEILQAAWPYSTGAFGCAVALWLILFAAPAARRFALRHAWLPGLLGAAGWLGTQWWLLHQV